MSFDKNMFLGWVQNKMDNDQAHKEARNSSYLEQQKIQGDIFNALNKEPAPSLFDSIARVTNNESEKKNLSDNLELDESVDLEEKNVPNDPKKWAASKAAARAKFDVYPSAYANAWASKDYKSKGGTWRKAKSEDVEYDQVDELKKSTIMNYKDRAKAQRNDIARRNQSVKGPLIGKDADQMIKRGKGVDLATKKLVAREYEKEDVDEGLMGTIGKAALAGGAAYAAHKLSKPENRKKVGDAVKGATSRVKSAASKLVTPERKEKIKSGLKSVAKDVASTAAEKLKQKAADKVAEYGKPEKKDGVQSGGKLRIAR